MLSVGSVYMPCAWVACPAGTACTARRWPHAACMRRRLRACISSKKACRGDPWVCAGGAARLRGGVRGHVKEEGGSAQRSAQLGSVGGMDVQGPRRAMARWHTASSSMHPSALSVTPASSMQAARH